MYTHMHASNDSHFAKPHIRTSGVNRHKSGAGTVHEPVPLGTHRTRQISRSELQGTPGTQMRACPMQIAK